MLVQRNNPLHRSHDLKMQLTLKRNTTAVILVRKLDCSVSHHREETVYVNVRSLNDNLVINSNDFHSAGFQMSLDVGKKHHLQNHVCNFQVQPKPHSPN